MEYDWREIKLLGWVGRVRYEPRNGSRLHFEWPADMPKRFDDISQATIDLFDARVAKILAEFEEAARAVLIELRDTSRNKTVRVRAIQRLERMERC